MRYMMFVCVDPTGEKYVPAEDNIDEWVEGGFDLLECADLDEAIEVASKHPMARFGRIELRALWPEE